MNRKTILDYVYQHFSMYFEMEEKAIQKLNIIFPYSGEHFFHQKQAKPGFVNWKTWDNENLPILFDSHSDNQWYEWTDNQLIFHYDLPSMIFYFLSGWQEEHGNVVDRFGRFPYAESIQKDHQFVMKPVVSHYFFILRQGIESFTQTKIALKQKFTFNVTHDIDLVHSGCGTEIKKALKKGNLIRVASIALGKTKGIYPNQNLEEIIAFEKANGICSTFYFIPTNDKQNGIQNADYTLEEPYIKNVIGTIQNDPDFELGLHTPAANTLNSSTISHYIQALGGQVRTNRFHYLALQQRNLKLFEGTSIENDSSLGFAEHIGFRHSIAWPFHPYDFEEHRPLRLLEIPLVVMDTSLIHPQYMNRDKKQSIEAIKLVASETKKVNGTLTLLWHNDKFDWMKEMWGELKNEI